MDFELVDDSKVMDLVDTPLSTTDKVNEIPDQLTGDIAIKHLPATTRMATEEIMKMDLESTSVPSTDVTKKMKQETGGISVCENFETIPLLYAERVGETLMTNHSAANIVSDKGMIKMEIDTETNKNENEKMKTPNAEVKMQTIASGKSTPNAFSFSFRPFGNGVVKKTVGTDTKMKNDTETSENKKEKMKAQRADVKMQTIASGKTTPNAFSFSFQPVGSGVVKKTVGTDRKMKNDTETSENENEKLKTQRADVKMQAIASGKTTPNAFSFSFRPVGSNGVVKKL